MGFETDNLRSAIRACGIRAFSLLFEEEPLRKGLEFYYFCRWHEDTNQSLRVNEQKMTYYCDVCLKKGDIFHAYAKLNGLNDRRDYPKILNGLADLLSLNQDNPPAQNPVNPVKPGKFKAWEDRQDVTAVYQYEDETGQFLFEKAKFLGPDGSKSFQQRMPTGIGWTYNTQGVRRVPYRLREVVLGRCDCGQGGIPAPVTEQSVKGLGRQIVVICEGEKDTDTLHSAGILGTTTPDGAGVWRAEWNDYFVDQEVLIVPDEDEPGLKHANLVASHLAPVAREVRIFRLTSIWHDVPKGGDVTDFVMTSGLPVEQAVDVQAWWNQAERIDAHAATKARLAALDCKIEDTESILNSEDSEAVFVLGRVLPTHGFSLIASAPGIGKSTLSRNLALAVARGQDFLGFPTMRGPVLMFPLEEDHAEVRRHLRSLGLQPGDRVIVAHLGDTSQCLTILSNLVASYHPVLVIIDPLQEFINLREINSYGEVYAALRPIRELARNSGAHVTFLHHCAKANEWILGSQAIKGAMDSTFIYKKAEGNTRILECDKIRLGEPFEPIAIRFDPVTRAISYGGTADEAQDQALCRRIADLIRIEARPLSRNEIAQATGAPWQQLWRALAHSDGILIRSGKTRLLYSLAEPGSPSTDQEEPWVDFKDPPF